MTRVSIILGTRPEVIKFSPIIRECKRSGLSYFILHTGQHYSYNMDKVFFEQLGLPDPKYNLEVGSGTHAEQTGRMMIGIEAVLKKEMPDVVLVEGDTNTVLAGALAAVKLAIKVGHVEAGLRSYDRTMPEETNRVLVDHCSDYLFAPTEKSKGILIAEGIAEEKISVTGNTVVDAVLQNLELSEKRSGILSDLGLKRGGYLLATVHRQENVDVKGRLQGILEGLKRLRSELGLPIVYPVHPRTKERVRTFGLDLRGIQCIDPLDYLGFLQLERNARLILTDSGGVQEEACILEVPCVTLRDNTERPETIKVRANILAGTEPKSIVEKASMMLARERNWPDPLGDGRATERIVKIIWGSQ